MTILATIIVREREMGEFQHCGSVAGNREHSTTRIQLELTPQAMERLDRMKNLMEAASYAEVIRNALRLFEASLTEHRSGSEFAVKRASGETAAYKIFV